MNQNIYEKLNVTNSNYFFELLLTIFFPILFYFKSLYLLLYNIFISIVIIYVPFLAKIIDLSIEYIYCIKINVFHVLKRVGQYCALLNERLILGIRTILE